MSEEDNCEFKPGRKQWESTLLFLSRTIKVNLLWRVIITQFIKEYSTLYFLPIVVGLSGYFILRRIYPFGLFNAESIHFDKSSNNSVFISTHFCLHTVKCQDSSILKKFSLVYTHYIKHAVLWHIIIIIMSCRQHGYPWPSLAISTKRSSLLVGPQGYIPYPHRAAVCRFELFIQLLLGHVRGSMGEHHLSARPCFSSSILHVCFV